MKELIFGELLASRINHDLAGPVGAVNNGIDFLNNADEEIQENAKKLIADSAMRSVRSLQFLRLVYGPLNLSSLAVISQINDITQQYYIDSKIKFSLDYIDVTDEQVKKVSPEFLKLILNLIQITGSALLKGGEVKVNIKPKESAICVTVQGKGALIKINDFELKMLSENVDITKVNSKNVNFYYCRKLLDEVGCKIKIDLNSEQIMFEIE